MAYFNIVAQTSENTVVTEYEPVEHVLIAIRAKLHWKKNSFAFFVSRAMNICRFIQKRSDY